MSKGKGQIDIEDCAEISRTVSALLDVEEPISETYRLEVSSSGIDRPLWRPADFEIWRGFEAKVDMVVARKGCRRFTGRLDGIKDGSVVLVIDGESVLLPLVDIGRSKLVLTDELIAHVTGSGRRDDGTK